MKIIYAKTAEAIRRSDPKPGDIVMTGIKGRNAAGARVVVDTDPYTDAMVLRPEWCAPRAESDDYGESIKCSPFKMENTTPGSARRTGRCRFCRWCRSRHSMHAADMLHDMCKWSRTMVREGSITSLCGLVEYMRRTEPWSDYFKMTVFPWRRMRGGEI